MIFGYPPPPQFFHNEQQEGRFPTASKAGYNLDERFINIGPYLSDVEIPFNHIIKDHKPFLRIFQGFFRGTTIKLGEI
jgi:hypothetical protein